MVMPIMHAPMTNTSDNYSYQPQQGPPHPAPLFYPPPPLDSQQSQLHYPSSYGSSNSTNATAGPGPSTLDYQSRHQQQHQSQQSSSLPHLPQDLPRGGGGGGLRSPRDLTRSGNLSAASSDFGGGGGRASTTTSVSLDEYGQPKVHTMPRVGAVRCYWALLTPRHPLSAPSTGSTKFELEFLHLDPVLGAHMRAQSLSMLGRGVLEFVHPEEREQARRDLHESIKVDNLEGSVTRVRFARLSRIRTQLGCPPEDDDIPDDAHLFVEDDEYLALDLSIHWACNGILLAFFHAIRDIDPQANNDPNKTQDIWTNYCGTACMPEDQIESLWANVTAAIPTPVPSLNANTAESTPTLPPERVFIIHSTEEAPVRPNSTIFAWPPPRIRISPPNTRNSSINQSGLLPMLDSLSHAESNLRQGESGGSISANGEDGEETPRMDGSYWAEDYAELMRHVELKNQHGPEAWGTAGKTSCTSRFQGGHFMFNEGVFRKVESIFIPYGSITFACFQTKSVEPLDEASRPEQNGQWSASSQGPGAWQGPDGNVVRPAFHAPANFPLREEWQRAPPFGSGEAAPDPKAWPQMAPPPLSFPPTNPGLRSFPARPLPPSLVRPHPYEPTMNGQRYPYPQAPRNGLPASGYDTTPSLQNLQHLASGMPNPTPPATYSSEWHGDGGSAGGSAGGMPSNISETSSFFPYPGHNVIAPPTPVSDNGNGLISSTAYYPPSSSSSRHVPLHPMGPGGSVGHSHSGSIDGASHGNPAGPSCNPYSIKRSPASHSLSPDRSVNYSGPSSGYSVGAPSALIHSVANDSAKAMDSPDGYRSPDSSISHQTQPQHQSQPATKKKASGPLRKTSHDPGSPPATSSTSGRPPVPPPEGVDCCVTCQRKESPEWRKSERGIKELCNACGLKLARLQAKREGRQKPRKRKTTSGGGGSGSGLTHLGGNANGSEW